MLPLFGDQPDNAQRIHEKGFGIRLDAYQFTENELFESIDKLLNDDQVQKRVKAAAERINKSNSKELVCKRIEDVVAKHTNNNFNSV